MNQMVPGPGLEIVKPESGTKGSTVKAAEAAQLESTVEVIMTRRVPGVIKGGIDHNKDPVEEAMDEVTVASKVKEVVGYTLIDTDPDSNFAPIGIHEMFRIPPTNTLVVPKGEGFKRERVPTEVAQ